MIFSTHAAAPAPIGVLVSGGLDSCILLARLLDEGRAVQPFYIRSGLAWETAELDALRRFLDRVSTSLLAPLLVLDLPLSDLYSDHCSVTGCGVPDELSPDEAVFLPGRNALLAIKAAIWCQLHGVRELALATLKGNPFGDATDEFFAAYERALTLGLATDLRILRPFAQLSKREVMQLGQDYPLEATFSCIAPRDGLHCGHCNKCAERRRAFIAAEIQDPTRYADGSSNGNGARATSGSRLPDATRS